MHGIFLNFNFEQHINNAYVVFIGSKDNPIRYHRSSKFEWRVRKRRWAKHPSQTYTFLITNAIRLVQQKARRIRNCFASYFLFEFPSVSFVSHPHELRRCMHIHFLALTKNVPFVHKTHFNLWLQKSNRTERKAKTENYNETFSSVHLKCTNKNKVYFVRERAQKFRHQSG